jgi:hypothetical protein
MLIVHVCGGLGNQLFQYAFYLFLKKNNDEVFLDISEFEKNKFHFGFELSKVFNVDYELINEKDIKDHVMNNNVICKIIKKLINNTVVGAIDYYGNDDISLVKCEKILENVYFKGFWQDKYYIEEVKNEIYRNVIYNSFELSEKNKQLLSVMKEKDCTSIHIRRGDYLHHSNFQGICTEKYYTNAIDYIDKNTNNALFIVFSDDISWCKKTLQKLNNRVVYVDWNEGENSYLDMYLMSNCNNNIIANSTFSWWGAFLNQNKSKVVVCPSKWNNVSNKNRLMMDGWIGI